ncbi:hypothetical protein [Variovorax sp. RCC_210]|uniref:hypothetical protein n=1 Tax=Variovorax sp. RCC_210 TaxID=3239217 RepID=UPI003526BB1E
MIKDLSLVAETLTVWAALPLGVLGLVAMLASVLAPDRLLFEAGYTCEPRGTELRLFPRHVRFSRFMWWLLGLGVLLMGLAMLLVMPMMVVALAHQPFDAWYHWPLFVALTLAVVATGAFMCWLGCKLMRMRWFGGRLRETRFFVDPQSGEPYIEIRTSTLLQRNVVREPLAQLSRIVVSARDSWDVGAVTGQASVIHQQLVQLGLAFGKQTPIDLVGRVKDGQGVRRMITLILGWCGEVELRFDRLRSITPFDMEQQKH